MDKIIQEKISADHLLYVSLKYTKTGDVILNLIKRWASMIEAAIDYMLDLAKSKKKISMIPVAPKMKVEKAKELCKKNSELISGIELYEFFKRVPLMEKLKENEFRKNVTLKVNDNGKWADINFDKLKEYAAILEKFISHLKQFLKK